eukprot:1297763-Amphidinium_carterae.2
MIETLPKELLTPTLSFRGHTIALCASGKVTGDVGGLAPLVNLRDLNLNGCHQANSVSVDKDADPREVNAWSRPLWVFADFSL